MKFRKGVFLQKFIALEDGHLIRLEPPRTVDTSIVNTNF